MKIIFLYLSFIFPIFCFAQNKIPFSKINADVYTPLDLSQLRSQMFERPDLASKPVLFMKPKKNTFIRKINPVFLFFGSLMYGYQKFISSQLASNCAYEPHCSAFSKEVIREYGLFKGIFLSADRLTRCTPFTLIDINSMPVNVNSKVIDPPKQYRLK